jgi:hypothetical protein
MPSDDVLARHLQGWLLARGFVAVNEPLLHEEAAVRMVDLARQPLRVRLVSDRGAWSMEVAGPDGHWIDLELWRDFLDGSAYSAGPSSFADCVAILRARLEEISALASSADFAVTAAALAALHRQRAVARYGVPL